MSEGVEEISFISEDKETCCRYVLLLAKTCQIKNITKLCLTGGWGEALQNQDFVILFKILPPPKFVTGTRGLLIRLLVETPLPLTLRMFRSSEGWLAASGERSLGKVCSSCGLWCWTSGWKITRRASGGRRVEARPSTGPRDSVINLIPQTAASIGNCLSNAKHRDFLPSYLERNSEHIRPLATVLSTEEVNKTIQRQSRGQFHTFRRWQICF